MTATRTGKLFSLLVLTAMIALFIGIIDPSPTYAAWPKTAPSKDGTPISYEVYGEGEPTLVFVHGWSCDSRYWRKQVEPFSKDHRIVLVDLAGHGHSGSSRTDYSMPAFGEDVKAVCDAADAEKVILIGHSMGGLVTAEAAKLMPGKVLALIGIDNLQDVEYQLTDEKYNSMTTPLKEDFQNGCRHFAGSMIASNVQPELREFIVSDMSAANPAVALSAMTEMLTLYRTGQVPTIFDDLEIPVITVNADMWPVNHEANRRHMHSFDAIILPNTGHFLMMTRPDEFNPALKQAIARITSPQQDPE